MSSCSVCVFPAPLPIPSMVESSQFVPMLCAVSVFISASPLLLWAWNPMFPFQPFLIAVYVSVVSVGLIDPRESA